MKTLKITFLIAILSIFAFPTMADTMNTKHKVVMTKHGKVLVTKHGKVVKVVYVRPMKVVKVVYVRVPRTTWVKTSYHDVPKYYSHNSSFRSSHGKYRSTLYFNRHYTSGAVVPMKKLVDRYAI